MNRDEYKKEILSALLQKYRKRLLRGDAVSKRRIGMEPKKLLPDYDENTADIDEKQKLTDAADLLETDGFVSVRRLKYSNDILKIYLCEDQAARAEAWMTERFGYVSADSLSDRITQILEEATRNGPLTCCYEAGVRDMLLLPGKQPEESRVRDMLAVLSFLENNHKALYVREASVLSLGDSKKIEEQYLNEICAVIREACADALPADSTQEDCLALYSVFQTDREILLKGNWFLAWETVSLDVSAMTGGIAISGSDMERLTHVRVDAPEVMTVENKTSFHRMGAENRALLYLGGFAGKRQIAFLKKVYDNMQSLRFSHFGDIDVGGFLIHRHLTEQTGIPFEMYRMGIAELQEARFAHALRPLTEKDRERAKTLMEHPLYGETLRYMMKHGVKLEQEIVSYHIR